MWNRRLQAPAGVAKTPGKKMFFSVYCTHLWVTTWRMFQHCWKEAVRAVRNKQSSVFGKAFSCTVHWVYTVLEIWPDLTNKNPEAPNMAWMRHRLLGRLLSGPPTCIPICGVLWLHVTAPLPPTRAHMPTHSLSRVMCRSLGWTSGKLLNLFHLYIAHQCSIFTLVCVFVPTSHE